MLASGDQKGELRIWNGRGICVRKLQCPEVSYTNAISSLVYQNDLLWIGTLGGVLLRLAVTLQYDEVSKDCRVEIQRHSSTRLIEWAVLNVTPQIQALVIPQPQDDNETPSLIVAAVDGCISRWLWDERGVRCSSVLENAAPGTLVAMQSKGAATRLSSALTADRILPAGSGGNTQLVSVVHEESSSTVSMQIRESPKFELKVQRLSEWQGPKRKAAPGPKNNTVQFSMACGGLLSCCVQDAADSPSKPESNVYTRSPSPRVLRRRERAAQIEAAGDSWSGGSRWLHVVG